MTERESQGPPSDRPSDASDRIAVPGIGQNLPAQGQPPSLEALLEAAGPLAKSYFESQERMQHRDLEFEAKVLTAESQQTRVLTISIAVVVSVVLALSGFLIFKERVDAAVDLIKLVAAIIGVGVGGYGLAMGRRRREAKEE
jgi:hypothetical protein